MRIQKIYVSNYSQGYIDVINSMDQIAELYEDVSEFWNGEPKLDVMSDRGRIIASEVDPREIDGWEKQEPCIGERPEVWTDADGMRWEVFYHYCR